MGLGSKLLKFTKQATGIQAIQDKREASEIIEKADLMRDNVEQENNRIIAQLNSKIEQYQSIQKNVLHNTIGRFREYLKDMNWEKQDNEYGQIDNIAIDKIIFQSPDTHLQGKEIIKTVAAGVAFGVFAAGYTFSKYYAEKLTQATQYFSKVKEFKAHSERQWTLINAMIRRTEEQGSTLNEIGRRSEEQLDYLQPIALEFIPDEIYHTIVVQKNQVFLKPIVEICKTPIVDDLGNLNNKWGKVKAQTSLLLEKNL